MSSTAKTVLIVAGAGVGVFVLLKLLSPSPLVRAYGRQPANTGTGTVQGLIGLGAAIGSGLKGLFGGSSSSSSGAFDGGAYSDAASQAAIHGLQGSDTVTVTDGFIFTDPGGDFIAG